jgi:branched-chain amino acid aminotransferase
MRTWVGERDAGELVDEDRARISVLDHGFTVADGVFETLKVTRKGAFALTRHLARLHASATILGMVAPDPEVVRYAVEEVLTANAAEVGAFGRLRITYTSGVAPLGSERGDSDPTLVVALARSQPWPPTTTLVTAPWTRNERSAVAGAKTTSYAENVVALKWAHEAGASEALLANTRGELCEGTGTNVFVVLDGRVVTPSLSSGCLAGITRDLVIDWFGADEATLPMSVLQEADEVFVTSSTRGVHPALQVDGRHWDIAGPISRDLRAAFDELAERRFDPVARVFDDFEQD